MTTDPQSSQIADLQADNARLRRLLDQQSAPAELRHRLRNMVGLLRSIIRQSSRTRSGEDLSARVENRLDALMRVQGAIDLLGEVSLHTIIADELLSHTIHEGKRLSLSGPEVMLQPKAAQVMGLVFHELAVNAIEHGGLLSPNGKIDVSWHLDSSDPDFSLRLTWKETGSANPPQPQRSGFGMEMMTEMVRYTLKTETSIAYEPDGLRYTLIAPALHDIGRLADQR